MRKLKNILNFNLRQLLTVYLFFHYHGIHAQFIRYPVFLPNHYGFIELYLDSNNLNINKLRKITDLLCNPDISTFNGIQLPKRKKAFIRHIKHLNEALEYYSYSNKELDSTGIEMLVELEYLKRSYINKAEFNSKPVAIWKEFLKFGKTIRKSKRFFTYEIQTVTIAKEQNSPYWHATSGELYKQFDLLAEQKNIKAKKNMVVLYDGLSNSGSAPKINTLDADLDNEWSLKWGDELHSDVAGSRIFAALGYDVDHPYFYKNENLTLVFDSTKSIYNWRQLKDSLYSQYKVDITPYFYKEGRVSAEMIAINKRLQPYLGNFYVQFIKCGIEARPDRVKRLGSFLPNDMHNDLRRELRASILLHAFIGNWDTREENTLLTLVHDGNYNYRMSAVFSDLGTSFGVKVTKLPLDFKVGLVNNFTWEVVERKRDRIRIKNPVNAILLPYEKASFSDLHWMAVKIAQLDSLTLRKCLEKARWPAPIEELYFHKLASRRASIINAFQITDPHPISFDKKLTIQENGKTVVKRGKLVRDYKREENPESFIKTKGRKRNYGN